MLTHVHDEGDLDLGIRYALLVYTDENGGNAYVTAHPVGKVKNRLQIGAGVPASRAALSELAHTINAVTATAGFLPDGLLYLSPRTLAWWCPPANRRVWFKCEEAIDKAKIGTRSAVVPHPGLVFTVTAEDWYVHAVKGAARPGPDTALLRAPYFNVWRHGGICTGNVKLPKAMTPDVTRDYERAFFDSRFTHPNDPQGLTRYKGGAWQLWRELLDGRHKTFPEAALAGAGLTLAEHIKKLESRHDARRT